MSFVILQWWPNYGNLPEIGMGSWNDRKVRVVRDWLLQEDTIAVMRNVDSGIATSSSCERLDFIFMERLLIEATVIALKFIYGVSAICEVILPHGRLSSPTGSCD